MSLIEVSQLEKSYQSETTSVVAVDNIDLKVHEGEFIVILGKSGSGKSTLLSLLAGLERPSSGDILFVGNKLNSLSQDKISQIRRDNMGIIFQHFHLLDAMTASENVELPLIVKKSKNRSARVNELLNLVGLSDRAAHFPSELSGGERQRIAIARALANKPKIIFADEPTGDLDSKTGNEIIEFLFEINKGVSSLELDWQPTIIMVTHDLSMVKEGMRVITLSDGRIIEDKIK